MQGHPNDDGPSMGDGSDERQAGVGTGEASTSGAGRKGLTAAAGGWAFEYSVPREETSGDSVDGWVEGEWRRAGHQWWWPLVLAQTSSPVARVWGGGSFCLSDGSGEERKRGVDLGEGEWGSREGRWGWRDGALLEGRPLCHPPGDKLATKGSRQNAKRP